MLLFPRRRFQLFKPAIGDVKIFIYAAADGDMGLVLPMEVTAAGFDKIRYMYYLIYSGRRLRFCLFCRTWNCTAAFHRL